MVAVVARPPYELNNKMFFDKMWYYMPSNQSNAVILAKFFYKIQQQKFFEEVTGLFVSINWEKWSENVLR